MPGFFKKLPNLIFAYWINNKILKIFKKNNKLEGTSNCLFGLHARGNDERVYRTWWEIKPSTNFNKEWPVVKLGGNPNRFCRNSEYIVDWRDKGKLLKEIAKQAQGGCLTGYSHYFKPGLSYVYTGNTFTVQPLEENSIFSAAAHGLIPVDKNNSLFLISLLNSEIVRLLLKTINPDRFFQTAYVRSLPLPKCSVDCKNELETVGLNCYTLKRKHLYGDECSRWFFKDWSIINQRNQKGQNAELISDLHRSELDQLSQKLNELNKLALKAYRLDSDDITQISERTITASAISLGSDVDTVNDIKTIITSQLSYVVGIVVGRWNIFGTKLIENFHKQIDPFEQLPVCPPGMLQNASGLPAEPDDIPDDYPLRITWPGIIVNDEGHPEDIVTRVREAMEVIWKEKAGDIEQEACEILNIGGLRDYFSKPAKFFADHLKRYSKSRRKAPIYWPLSTPSGSYTLWLYYHRLTDQTLYTCVNNFVAPKLESMSATMDSLRKKTGRSTQEEKELETLSDLVLELTDFRDELLRIAQFWKPNLNDGVVITAAPLWRLFQHKPWHKILKQAWAKLEKGEYDWAHLACSIWPDRVIRASHKDRSYAIAHDLEEELWDVIRDLFLPQNQDFKIPHI
jgi:hypothetical protein